MKTLIVYDSTGREIFSQGGFSYEPVGEIKALKTDIPENKILKGVDVKTGEAILEDVPKSQMELLQEELAQNTKEMAKKDLAIEQLQKDLADLTKQIALGGNV
ncbi:hypothetical protein FDE76_15690 [Clostridium botulinum]|uniref:Uncharacterized protein n=1 Tax=Clostridium botulinum (strain Eklund 17B / Type B) TaxID=935198 RepID=B2TNU6_CLOBB|nr:conserved hypothetical protein [Clostridium botulinum B str. Eklund 17B (NRP)]MBY6976217.1 hypothetical protein [Clostridium botulinum]MBY7000642.1 hypothetical protein [Clostridium botulinum]MCR1273405.1 hypothetical protein [Clostridium botulinum]NFD71334.1 hypothetical protein [Clostridium botulinum]